MPIYSFICPKCGHWDDVVASMAEAPKESPCSCNGIMTRDFGRLQLGINMQNRDYVTADITGEPVHIKSVHQEKELCELHGVSRATSDETFGNRKPRKKPKSVLMPLREHFEKRKHEMKQEMGIS